LEARLTLDPTAARFHQALAALVNVFPPTQVPPQEVADLFDRYADRFDRHLVGELGYRVPELIADAVKAAVAANRGSSAGDSWDSSGPSLDVLDLGCGTGLCGPLLRPLARTLAGVDLSAAMVDKARERGVYDRVDVGDLVAALTRSPAAWDVLAAADVLLYLGDLAPTFEAAAAALRPGGLLAFTVEAGGGERYTLNQQTRRYTHSEAYLRKLATIYGFDVQTFATTALRMDRGKPVAGFLVVLRVPG
jgi:predicted TPR repeat methyltransferase